MGTISDFLGRKGVASAPLPVPPSPNQRGTDSTAQHDERTFADLGARIGEGNDAATSNRRPHGMALARSA